MKRIRKQDTYFIANQQGLIKIGRSCHVDSRLYNLQCELGEKLTLLAAVHNSSLEGKLHRRFASFRADYGGKEWFYPNAELLAYIEDLGCSPATYADLKQAVKTLWDIGLGFGEYQCDYCNRPIPWLYLMYPYFEERCKQFYLKDVLICPICYHRVTMKTILSDRIVRAHMQYPPDHETAIALLIELHRPCQGITS